MEFNELRSFTLELIDKVNNGSADNVKIKFDGAEISVSKAEKVCIAQPQTVTVSPPVSEAVPLPVKEEAPDKVILSPMVGTFYSAPSPESKPFVATGDTIKEGDVICIVEAMKLMNEITADKSGTVKEILVGNGDVVGFHQPILSLE